MNTLIKEHHHGIDLLRIVAIIMITTHHVILHSKLLSEYDISSINYEITLFMNILSYCAVNCFGLITGYVMYENKVNYSKIINLYAQVLFYTLGTLLILYLINPIYINKKEILCTFFPFLCGKYWYFTAYTCVFFFIPYLNKLIENLDIQNIKRLLLKLIIIFSILPTIFFYDIFQTNSGYSALWLAILYLIGASIKKLNVKKINKKKLIGLYLLITILNWLIITLFDYFIHNEYLLNYKNILMPYISPVMLFGAIILLLIFKNSEIKNKAIKNFIKFASPTVFGIYLFQENSIIKNIIYASQNNIKNENTLLMIVSILKYVLIIYIIGLIIEKFRIKLFNLFFKPSQTFLEKIFFKMQK